jgi:hypothetical protein
MAITIQRRKSPRLAEKAEESAPDVMLTEELLSAPPVIILPDSPTSAELTEQRSPFSEWFNSCMPVICKTSRKISPGKERKSPTPDPSKIEISRGERAAAEGSEGMDFTEGEGESDPLERFSQERSTEVNPMKSGRKKARASGGEIGDAVFETQKLGEIPSVSARGLEAGLAFSPRADSSSGRIFRRLGWRLGGSKVGPEEIFPQGKKLDYGDEMVFSSKAERARFFHFYPNGKAFPGRVSKRAARESNDRFLAPGTERLRWTRGMMQQQKKVDGLSKLANEFVSTVPTRYSPRAATWLKEMDRKSLVPGAFTPGEKSCVQCGREGSPECTMVKCKGRVSFLLGPGKPSAPMAGCGNGQRVPGECNRVTCKECKLECSICGEAVCGTHSWSVGFGCARRRYVSVFSCCLVSVLFCWCIAQLRRD